jgi:hypothetical protein
MHAVGADAPGHGGVRADQEHEAATAGEARELAGQGLGPLAAEAAKDDPGARREGAGGRHRVRRPVRVGEEKHSRRPARPLPPSTQAL